MDERLSGNQCAVRSAQFVSTGHWALRIAHWALAILLGPGSAAAIQPRGPQPGAERGLKVVGREQNGLTFRKADTLIYRASRRPRHVDLEALRRRKIEQVTHRARHTDTLTSIKPIDSDAEEPLLPDQEPAGPADLPQEPAGVRTWHVLAFVAFTAAAVVAVLWFTGRRR